MRVGILLSLAVSWACIPTFADEKTAPSPQGDRSSGEIRREVVREQHRFEQTGGPERRMEGQRPQAAERRLEQLRQRIEHLHREGRHEEAERIKNRLQQWVDHPIRDYRPERERPEPRRENRNRPEGHANRPSDRPSAERPHHVKQAIEHLHAAGWHELAERLAIELQNRMHNQDPHRESARGHQGNQSTPMPPQKEVFRALLYETMQQTRRDIEGKLQQMQLQIEYLRQQTEDQIKEQMRHFQESRIEMEIRFNKDLGEIHQKMGALQKQVQGEKNKDGAKKSF